MTKTEHLTNLIKLLVDNKEVCLKQYAISYEVDVRTTQRYIKDLIALFGDSMIKTKADCYKLINNELKSAIFNLSDDEFKTIIDLYYIINPGFYKNLEKSDQAVIKKLLDETKQIFMLKPNSFEMGNYSELISKLKNAIYHKRYIDIEYDNGERFFYSDTQPYKIVFAEGNWYLATITRVRYLIMGLSGCGLVISKR